MLREIKVGVSVPVNRIRECKYKGLHPSMKPFE
jgi:hypothetical protein